MKIVLSSLPAFPLSAQVLHQSGKQEINALPGAGAVEAFKV